MVGQATKFLLQLTSTVILARLLTPREFGLVAMVTPITGFVVLFKDLGLSMATVQRERITQRQVSTLFAITVLVSAVLALLVAALSPLIARFYGEPDLTWIAVALSCTFVFSGLTAQHTALIRRQMRFGTVAGIEVTALTSGVLVAIVLAASGAGYWAIVAHHEPAPRHGAHLVALTVASRASWTVPRRHAAAAVRSQLHGLQRH